MTTANSVAYIASQGLFSIVGAGGVNRFLHSSDGMTWIADGGGAIYSSGTGVAFGQGQWISVGSGAANSIASSVDAMTWFGGGKSILTVLGSGITFNANLDRWVAVGQGGNTLVISDDGTTWLTPNQIFTSAAFGVGSFYGAPVATTTPAGLIFISTDLIDVTLNGTFGVASNSSITVSGGLNVTGDFLVYGNWTLNQTTSARVSGLLQLSSLTIFNPGAFVTSSILTLSPSSILEIIVIPGSVSAPQSLNIAAYSELNGVYGAIRSTDPCTEVTPNYGSSLLSVTLAVAPKCQTPIAGIIDPGSTVTPTNDGGSGLTTAMIIGIAVGSVIGGSIIVIIVVLFTRAQIHKYQTVVEAELKKNAVDDIKRDAERAVQLTSSSGRTNQANQAYRPA